LISLTLLIFSCRASKNTTKKESIKVNNVVVIKKKVPPVIIDTKNIDADELMVYAESLQGINYKYGSVIKENGFDCSGFVWYVFNHFGITVPRVSEMYTNAGKEVDINDCKRGDIILFTGFDASSGKVGHMGFIVDNKKGNVIFIHSASGGGRGITISNMSDYFIKRFVKVIRVF
jgi:cell wall-associated NlpC family hydrolase